MKDLFITNMQLFCFTRLIDGLDTFGSLDYCDDFINSHSDGTHSLQEDPLVSKWFDAKFLPIFSDEETNSYERVSTFSANFYFWGD